MIRTILLRLLDTYFRHRWLYLLPILIMTIAGSVYTFTQEQVYISSGLIFTEQNPLLSSLNAVQTEGYSWSTPAQMTTEQISDLIRTDAFIRAVIAETDLEAEMGKGEAAVGETISDVRARIWAWIAGANQVQINAANPDPQVAYQLAEGTIKTFIQWKINIDRADSVTAQVFFQELIQRYEADVVDAQQVLKSYLESHPGPLRGERADTEQLEIDNLKAEVDLAETRLAQALEKAENALLAETQAESTIRQKYTVVDAPKVPDRPATSRRKMALNAAIFVAAGVILSGIAVAGGTVAERSFRMPVEVQPALGLAVLAILPDVSIPARRKGFWRRGRRSAAPAQTGEPGEEVFDNEKTPPMFQGENLEPRVQETGDAPIALDLQGLKVEFKQEHRVED